MIWVAWTEVHEELATRCLADSGRRRNTICVVEAAVRERRRTPAGGVQAEVQQRYVRLIAQGRLRSDQRRGRLSAMTMIHERPTHIQDRAQPGHWEGDLIMGAGNRSAIGTLVERTTRFVILLGFPNGVASADAVHHAITTALTELT